MEGIRKQIALVLALAIGGIAAACGPAAPTPETANDAKPADTSTPEATPSATPEATPSAAPSAAPSTAPSAGNTPPAGKGPAASTPLQASKMLEDVKKTGINLAKIPDLEKIPMAQKKKLMPLFQKSLGYADCKGCHVEGDFKAETRNIKITRKMWDEFVADLRDEKGGAVFCDTCHNGSEKNLARADHKAVEKFMEDEYEHKLTRADKKENECTSCHGDAMEMKIIDKLWGIAQK